MSLQISVIRLSILLLCAGLLGACANAPQSKASAPLPVPQAFKESLSSPVSISAADTTGSVENNAWWTTYQDPVLNSLVERANRGNTSIEAAAVRLAQARATAHLGDAPRKPVAALNAGVTRQQGPILTSAGEEGTLLTVGASASYEADIWGRLAQTRDAAALDAEARQWLLQSAQLLAQAQVVQTYWSLRAADEDIALLMQAQQADLETRRIQEFRWTAGSISELEWERARAQADLVAVELSTLQRARGELENTLAILLGESASGFHFDVTPWQSTLPPVRPGLPASVLARRPDVAAAQKSVLAAQQRLGVAQNAWLPGLTLTASAGYASPDVRDLFSASMQTLVFGALTSLPLLDGGRREAGVAMADAELQAAFAQYKEQTLQALREVEDQLAATRHLQQQSELTTIALQNAQRREALTGSRYRSGSISRMEWLESQKQQLQTQRKALQVRASQYQTSVALVRALGGGWN
jgi:multidrug efflux system outer membrane protein